MKKIGRKSPRLRLDAKSYRQLHRQILERDGWRCQSCGSMQHLQVHHVTFRSQSGDDVERNLITLCASAAKTSIECLAFAKLDCIDHLVEIPAIKSRHTIRNPP